MVQRFSSRLKGLLIEREISISGLSRLTGISRQSIYKWFETDNISKRSLEKLAMALGVTVDWLKYGEPLSTPNKHHQASNKNPFIKFVDNKAYIDTKAHLEKLDVLVGSYQFESGKISVYNTSSAVNPDSPDITKLEDLMQHIDHRHMRKFMVNFYQVIRTLEVTTFHFTPKHNQNLYHCTFMPMFTHNNMLEGVSFSIHMVLVNQQKLTRYMKKKCENCLKRFSCV